MCTCVVRVKGFFSNAISMNILEGSVVSVNDKHAKYFALHTVRKRSRR